MTKKLAAVILAVLILSGCAGETEPTVPSTTEPVWTMPVSPYEPSDFVQDGPFLSCAAGETVVGIDVSSHQQAIDWAAAAEAGVEFVFVRLGYRGYESGSLNMDEYAKDNLEGAKQAGLQVGAYFFSQAVTVEEAREEAAFALSILDGTVLDLPLVYDWEYVSDTARTANVDRRTLTDCTLAFCEAAEDGGYEAMIYFNTSQGRDMLYLEELEHYPWWLAKYDLSMDFLCRVDMWQYTNTGSVPGIAGNVDINLMFAEWGLGQEVWAPME